MYRGRLWSRSYETWLWSVREWETGSGFTRRVHNSAIVSAPFVFLHLFQSAMTFVAWHYQLYDIFFCSIVYTGVLWTFQIKPVIGVRHVCFQITWRWTSRCASAQKCSLFLPKTFTSELRSRTPTMAQTSLVAPEFFLSMVDMISSAIYVYKCKKTIFLSFFSMQ